MKVNEIIEQCNELLEDETYYLQTIELTKDEVKVLLEEIERLYNIIKELTQENLKRSDEIDKLLEIKNKAIEYIEDNTYEANGTEYMDLTGIKGLLEILDKENK